MFASIVVGTDGSDTARLAVHHAARLAAALGARLHIVSVYEPLTGMKAGRGGPESAVGPTSAVESVLEEAVGLARVDGAQAQTYARRGDAASVIIDVAEEQDAGLVVVGSKGMHGRRRYLVGSVPDKVSHHAPCSVLVVRTD